MTKERLYKATVLNRKIEKHAAILNRMRNLINTKDPKDRVSICIERPHSDSIEPVSVELEQSTINAIIVLLDAKYEQYVREFEAL